jgi:hypothetical protein
MATHVMNAGFYSLQYGTLADFLPVTPLVRLKGTDQEVLLPRGYAGRGAGPRRRAGRGNGHQEGHQRVRDRHGYKILTST